MDPLKVADTLRKAAMFHVEMGNIDGAILMSARAAELEREAFKPKPDTSVIL